MMVSAGTEFLSSQRDRENTGVAASQARSITMAGLFSIKRSSKTTGSVDFAINTKLVIQEYTAWTILLLQQASI